MKKIFVLAMVVVGVTILVMQDAKAMGTYSEGYRMGQLTKYSVKGMVFKSGEGQLLMGSESTVYQITDSEGNKKMINPWYFSVVDDKMKAKLKKEIGNYLVLEYHQARVKSPKLETEYTIVNVEKIGLALTKTCSAKEFTDGSKSEGTRVGRIVKASRKGTMSKSWEIIIQQGNSGNQFKAMSISDDEELYDCAVEFLKAGQKVKMTYDESHLNLNVFGRDTNYDLVKIEPIKSGLN